MTFEAVIAFPTRVTRVRGLTLRRSTDNGPELALVRFVTVQKVYCENYIGKNQTLMLNFNDLILHNERLFLQTDDKLSITVDNLFLEDIGSMAASNLLHLCGCGVASFSNTPYFPVENPQRDSFKPKKLKVKRVGISPEISPRVQGLFKSLKSDKKEK